MTITEKVQIFLHGKVKKKAKIRRESKALQFTRKLERTNGAIPRSKLLYGQWKAGRKRMADELVGVKKTIKKNKKDLNSIGSW